MPAGAGLLTVWDSLDRLSPVARKKVFRRIPPADGTDISHHPMGYAKIRFLSRFFFCLVMKHTVDVMISEQEIATRIAELGREISEHYQASGSEMVLVGLLRGSFMFMADLCRVVTVPHEVDFMTASSYGNGMSSTRDGQDPQGSG